MIHEDQQPDPELEAELRHALRVPAPVGLTARVHAACGFAMPRRSPVLARIFTKKHYAVAASLLLTAALGLWLSNSPAAPASLDTHVSQLMEDLDLAEPEAPDARIVALSADVEQGMAEIEVDLLAEFADEEAEQLSDELLLMEAEFDVF